MFAGSSILIRAVYRVMVRFLAVEAEVVLKTEVANPGLSHKASFNVVKRNRFAGSRARVSCDSSNYNRKSCDRRRARSLIARGRGYRSGSRLFYSCKVATAVLEFL
jgi:hypothetical protein